MPHRGALRALDAVTALADGPLTQAELARRLGVNRSSALRLLADLVAEGWAIRDAAGRYVAGGPRLWQLLHEMPDQAEIRSVVDPILTAAREAFGESAAFAVRAGDAMVYTSYLPATHEIGLMERLGSRRPLHCSALGKAFLSALPHAELAEEAERLSYVGGTSRAPATPQELLPAVMRSREQGYALDLGETIEDAHCVAVPVVYFGTIFGAAGIQGPSERLSEARLREIGSYLSEQFRVARERTLVDTAPQ